MAASTCCWSDGLSGSTSRSDRRRGWRSARRMPSVYPAPEPGREAVQRAAVLVNRGGDPPVDRSPQVGRFLGPLLQVLLIAQGAPQGEFVQRRLAAQKRGELREVFTVEAHGFRGESTPGSGRQIVPGGSGQWDRIGVHCPLLPRGSAPLTQEWRGWGVTVDQALRARAGFERNAGCREPPPVGRVFRSQSVGNVGRVSKPRHPTWSTPGPIRHAGTVAFARSRFGCFEFR